MVVYMVSYGLTRSRKVSHHLVRLYTDMAPVSIFKSFGPSVTRIRPRLVRLYVRFTRVINRISRVFYVRQALRTQRGDAGKARTHGSSVSSQAFYH